MTLNLKLISVSGPYHAKVTTSDHAPDGTKHKAGEIVLEPGAENTFYVHSGRSFEVREMSEQEVAEYNAAKNAPAGESAAGQ